ncbi:C3HC zinc finger-like-domain-containing protein [Xylariales sp. AK1849]|nr:C3HC zinc finger-like-domain-containing protein [Xylariales sp. AK1849]
MNATKRKFNALIQGIGNRSSPLVSADDTTSPNGSSTDLAPPPASNSSTSKPPATSNGNMAPVSSISADFLAKRRRMFPVASGTGNETDQMNIPNVARKQYTPGRSTGTKTDTREPPKYCPGDREQLIRRLGTFQELTEWTPKPDKVNEVEWAKRGWICQAKERVRCTLCHKELVVKTNKREVDGKEVLVLVGSDMEEALVKRFSELIVDAHQDDCLWRKQGCDDSLLRLQITSAQAALPALRQRYDELCARPAFLPYLFNLRLPPSLSLDMAKAQLPPKFFTEPPPSSASPSTPKDVALALALTGWQGLTNPRIGPVPNSAACATCLRRLGLWMFKSKEVDPATGEILVPAPMDHLDPVREHRFFCPWRNAAAQRNPGSKASENENKAAWEVLALTVRNAAYLRGHGSQDRSHNKTANGHGRSKSSVVPGTLNRINGHAPTPSEGAITIEPPLLMLGPDMVEDDEEDEKERDVKDKERWARLRRVKSLFNTKNGRKLTRTLSRPGTAKSTATSGGGKE